MRFVAYINVLVVVFLAVYGLYYLVLLLLYLRHRRETDVTPPVDLSALPHVTVQVPVYNERHVIERAIDHVAALDYPRDRLHIQVLDDSTDETSRLACTRAALYRRRGVDVEVLHRPDRSGFKAGALDWGLSRSRGEYVAIFDADFCPRPDFLLRTVPHFLERPRLGFVQGRWTYLNVDYSLLTRAQTLAFDSHYNIEQTARSRSGLTVLFNGAGGVWRRRCIEEAGGWRSDTLCEDMDLSYRAQLAGWKPLYLPAVEVPAEIPPQVTALKHQQARWARGTTQVLRKLGPAILRSREFKLAQKIMALIPLCGYMLHPLLLLNLLSSLPLALASESVRGSLGALGALAWGPILVYIIAQQQLHTKWWRRLLGLPVLSLLMAGIAWRITREVWHGLTHWGGTFVRTPKFRLEGRAGQWTGSGYSRQTGGKPVGEIALALYALGTVVAALVTANYGLIPLTLVYAGGFIVVAWMELTQTREGREAPAPAPYRQNVA